MEKILMAGPVIKPGSGCNPYRVILWASYDRNNNPTKLSVHRQYMTLENGVLGLGSGFYRPVGLYGVEKATNQAFEEFTKRVTEGLKEYGFADYASVTAKFHARLNEIGWDTVTLS